MVRSISFISYYYRGRQLFAVQKGPFKAHFKTKLSYVPKKMEEHDPMPTQLKNRIE